MKNQEIIQMSTADLKDKINLEKDALNKLTTSHSISPIENPLRIKSSRKTIARLMTELNKRELNEKNNK